MIRSALILTLSFALGFALCLVARAGRPAPPLCFRRCHRC